MLDVLLMGLLAAPPAVEPGPCPVAVPAGTTCGHLVVPERRDVPGGRTIKVGYAVHRATGPDRVPDPIVYTSGGPGSSSVQLTGFLTGTPIAAGRDVVVLEQRGSRHSEPHLRCPEIEAALLDGLSRPGRDAAEADALTASARQCRDRLAGEGTDLRGYTTAEIAADVADLRKALGYDSWNLFGVSYSTRSMLAAAQLDPAGTRSVVLDSFLPAEVAHYDVAEPDLRATLERLEPGLAGRLSTVVARLNAAPAEVRAGSRMLHLTGDDVATLIAEGMQDADLVTAVPPLVHALADGRDDLLGPIGAIAADLLGSHDVGLYYAVNCQDEVPFNTFAPAGGPRSFFSDTDTAVCRGLGLPAGSTRGATTGAPVLVVGGALDPATPMAAARAAAARLPHATTVEFAGVAHAVFLTSRCGRETIAAFLQAPGSYAAPCDPADSPYRTLAAGDLHVTTVVHGAWWTFLAPGLLVLACLGALVTGVLRRRPTLVLAGVTGPALLGVAAVVLDGVSTGNPASLLVGVPWTVAWCVPLAGAVTALLGAATVRRGVTGIVLLAAATAHLLWWFTA